MPTTVQVTPDDRATTEEEYLGGLMDMEAEESTEESSWKCPQCGETVPDAFAVCWNCQASRSAQQTNSVGPETPRSAPGSPPDEAVVEATLVSDTHTRAPHHRHSVPNAGPRR